MSDATAEESLLGASDGRKQGEGRTLWVWESGKAAAWVAKGKSESLQWNTSGTRHLEGLGGLADLHAHHATQRRSIFLKGRSCV